MATSSTSATCSCRFMGGSFAGHYSKDTRTARRVNPKKDFGWPILAGFARVGSFSFPISIFYLRGGAELACGEIFQGAEACVEFGGREASQAVERAQKIRGRTIALARVAFHTGGNQVAVGIASEAHAWHNVVEGVHVSGSAAEAVKASAA